MKIKALYIFFFSIIFITCVFEEKEEKQQNKIKALDHVVLIFIDRPQNGYSATSYGSKLTTSNYHHISYYDDNLIFKTFTPDSLAYGDTLVIPTVQDYLEIVHTYKGLQKLSFLIEKGDTIIFQYEAYLPVAKSKKYGTSPSLNINANKIRAVYNNKLDTFSSYLAQDYKIKMKYPPPYNTEGYATARYKEIEQEKKWFEANYKEGKLSKLYYEYYIADLSVKKLLIENALSPFDANRFESYIDTFQDSLIHNSSYLNFLTEYVNNISKAVPIISIQNTGGGGRFKDYSAQYDIIKENKHLTPKAKDMLLYAFMEKIITEIKKPELTQNYFASFKKDVDNKNLIEQIDKKYDLNKKITKELQLVNFSGEQTTLENLISKTKRKYIYIDFWASWCKPCGKELPKSKILEERLKKENIDIVVFYISKDENQSNWIKSVKDYDLPVNNSYMVENPYSTNFFSDNNLRFIPFYILIDKSTGKKYLDAPRPSDFEKIKSLILDGF